jgi:hypothetical protein
MRAIVFHPRAEALMGMVQRGVMAALAAPHPFAPNFVVSLKRCDPQPNPARR